MKRRKFINTAGVMAVGVGTIPLVACTNSNTPKTASEVVVNEFTLPDLGYAYDALAPNIDARTMGIHHDKHHAGYVKKLNAALESSSLAGKSLEELMKSVKDVDGDIAVRNNGGGHYNHSLFWKVMKPGGSKEPKGKLADAIMASFDSLDAMKEAFSTAAKTQFGSGWAWLSVDKNNKLFISSTPNQDNPLMSNIVEEVGTPILGIDVWEHAYYLNYQNKRGDYISNFLELINWDQVSENYTSIG